MEPKTLKINKIYDEDMKEIDVARHPRQLIYIETDLKLPVNSMMRLKVFDKIADL